MAKIIVGFSRHKGFAPLSWGIQAIERTPYSHAYIKIVTESLNRTLIYQANNSGVWFIGEPAFLENNIAVEEYEFDISDSEKVKLLQFCIDNSGKKYAKLQLLGMFFCRIYKFFTGKECKNPLGDENRRFICTELVSAALNAVGFPKVEELDNIGLKELKERVEELKNAKV